MSAPATAPVTPPSDEAAAARMLLAWRLLPESLVFFLDLVGINRTERDVVDSLLFGAIFVANVSSLDRDREAAGTYAGTGHPIPDELRRPVSINAVAQSLRLPFETARRRVQRLARAGAVRITPQGVLVPTEVANSPDYLARVVERHHRLGEFYAVVRRLGAVPEREASAVAPAEAPIRISTRLLAEYMLRVVDDIVGLVGEPVAALVFLQLIRENTAGLSGAQLAAWTRAPARVGRPMRIAALARKARLPTETTRRHVLALTAAGFCVRTPTGFAATIPDGARAAVSQLVEDNLVNVQRLFARLRQLGTLSAWDG
jgi:DNA-binding Lrp family transcriptional regulator